MFFKFRVLDFDFGRVGLVLSDSLVSRVVVRVDDYFSGVFFYCVVVIDIYF